MSLNFKPSISILSIEILEFLKTRFENLKINHAPPRPGDVMHTLADISETKNRLGYDPEVQFWEGLEKTLEWWKLN